MGDPYAKGKPILAADLNTTHTLARQGAGLQGAAGGASGAPPVAVPPSSVFISVIARSVSTPSFLSEHSYTILLPAPGGGAGEEYEISYEQLIVPVEWSLVDPGAPRNMSFVPAAVVGDDEWAAQPWRARGILHRPQGLDASNERYAMVELFGLCPLRGC